MKYFMSKFKWYRKFIGGNWFKYEMTGQLPGCYGSFWSRIEFKPHRYYNLISKEHYD